MTQQEMITWLHDMAEGPMAHNPEHADTCNTLTAIRVELERLQAELKELNVKEGPFNTERWTLDALIAKMEEWRAIASEKTCVSFENLCFGASSLWHQTHREAFRSVDRKPEALSRWILDTEGSVKQDFPAQVLAVLERLQIQRSSARDAARWLLGRTNGFEEENEACKRWPWLEEYR